MSDGGLFRPAESAVTLRIELPRIGRFGPNPPWIGTSIRIVLPEIVPVACCSAGYWSTLQVSGVVVRQPLPGTASSADFPLPAKNVVEPIAGFSAPTEKNRYASSPSSPTESAWKRVSHRPFVFPVGGAANAGLPLRVISTRNVPALGSLS